MPWQQIHFQIDSELAQFLADLLDDCGATAVTMQDGADQPLYEPLPGETLLWLKTQVTGLFDMDSDTTAVVRVVRETIGLADLSHQVEILADQEWERVWLDNFTAMRFGTRLQVCPSGQPTPDPALVTVYLDPGMAFGTGTHPTTALCLEWLDGAELSGRVIIDYGCGSGILAVAAAKLGAEHVWAVDYDPQALLATRTNAKKNGVAKRISVVLPEQLPHQSVDIIVANILARPLTELAQRFAEVIHPGGDIVLSGILKEQHQTLLQAYQPWFDFNSEKSRDTWLCLTATRTGSCR